MKYLGPPNAELRRQIRLDEEKFAPVGNQGLIGFELDGVNEAIIPDVITKVIDEKSRQKSRGLKRRNKSGISQVESLALEKSAHEQSFVKQLSGKRKLEGRDVFGGR